VSFLFGFPILYYCAFKKRGTRWLTLSIWGCVVIFAIGAIQMICSLIAVYVLGPKGFYTTCAEALRMAYPGLKQDGAFRFLNTIWFLYVIQLIVGIIMFRYEFVLRVRNNIYQYKATLTSKDNRHAYAQIDASTSKEELDNTYKRLQVEFPHISKFLRFKYRRKKSYFEKAPAWPVRNRSKHLHINDSISLPNRPFRRTPSLTMR